MSLSRRATHAMWMNFGGKGWWFTPVRVQHTDLDAKYINGKKYIYVPDKMASVDTQGGIRVDFVHPKHHVLKVNECFTVVWDRHDEKDRHIIAGLLRSPKK